MKYEELYDAALPSPGQRSMNDSEENFFGYFLFIYVTLWQQFPVLASVIMYPGSVFP